MPAVGTLNSRFQFDDQITPTGGGTQGIHVVQHLQMANIIELVVAYLSGLGIKAIECEAPLSDEQRLSSPRLDLQRCEPQRPVPLPACHSAVTRILGNSGYRFAPKPSPLQGNAFSRDVDHRSQYQRQNQRGRS